MTAAELRELLESVPDTAEVKMVQANFTPTIIAAVDRVLHEVELHEVYLVPGNQSLLGDFNL